MSVRNPVQKSQRGNFGMLLSIRRFPNFSKRSTKKDIPSTTTARSAVTSSQITQKQISCQIVRVQKQNNTSETAK